MKITPEDYAILERAVKRAMSVTGLTLDNYTSLGLTAKRFRWDLLAHSKIHIGDGSGPANSDTHVNIYAYANKLHVDTALRKITNTR
ncbi:MAG: hypothetical protein WCY88_11210 [Spongiibacteraceae bacterium]